MPENEGSMANSIMVESWPKNDDYETPLAKDWLAYTELSSKNG